MSVDVLQDKLYGKVKFIIIILKNIIIILILHWLQLHFKMYDCWGKKATVSGHTLKEDI